ncbi:MAG: glutamate-cysteine ligase family protein [Mycobacteriales bacterium]
MIDETTALTRADLRSVFTGAGRAGERIGVEVEAAALDPVTGLAVPYAGPGGVRDLLRTLLEHSGGEPVHDGPYLTGVRLGPDGPLVSLELGGAVEYSSEPAPDLVTLVETTRRDLATLAELAARHGIALVPGGNLPFNGADDATWVPKARGEVMRRYYRRHGREHVAYASMTLALSTQVTVDYLAPDEDPHDLCDKLRALAAVGPVVRALCANSPLERGEYTGVLSRRGQLWGLADPDRSGLLPGALTAEPDLDGLLDWALALPMIYRRRGDTSVAAPDLPFGALLRAADPAQRAGLADWRAHLDQIWTDVRLRRTLELRGADGLTGDALAALPALWTGLSYHPPTRAAAAALTAGWGPGTHAAALRAAAHGLRGGYGRVRRGELAELARELVRLAGEGLAARVAAGRERPAALAYLDPLREIADTGVTLAERALRDWHGGWERKPERWVAHHRL